MQEEVELCSLTSRFEDFVLQFMDRSVVLFCMIQLKGRQSIPDCFVYPVRVLFVDSVNLVGMYVCI